MKSGLSKYFPCFILPRFVRVINAAQTHNRKIMFRSRELILQHNTELLISTELFFGLCNYDIYYFHYIGRVT